jgi:diguanylate cyclase (GGDEF)-like protein
MTMMALAAWQPAQKKMRREYVSRHTIVLPGIFSLVALVLLVSSSLHPLTPLSIALAGAALIVAGVRAGLTYMENVRMLERQTRDAITDSLTGLGNRRQLMDDLDIAVQRGWEGQPSTLAFFDLDGFKNYNDSFGHNAGDALLTRLGAALSAAVDGHGEAYRLGGDEFCVLLGGRLHRGDSLVARARQALSEQGSGFTITTSYGVVVIPDDASGATLALQLADERMYAEKGTGRLAHSQTQSVLMQLLTEREPTLYSHLCGVGTLAMAVGRQLDLDSEQLDELRRAAELHDIGKLALPDALLHKRGPLSDTEQSFMRQHTIVGERILNVAPALRPVARLVRASHERWDGNGYPDGLSGAAIPLGARIIAACDAYEAMTADRSYQTRRSPDEAMAELRRNAGSQFDPKVVELLCGHLETRLPVNIDGEQQTLGPAEGRPSQPFSS